MTLGLNKASAFLVLSETGKLNQEKGNTELGKQQRTQEQEMWK